MSTFRLIALLTFTLAAVAAAQSVDIDLPETIPDDPIDIRADRMEYTNGTIIATGNVVGRFERAVLSADELSGNPESGDIHVEGNVKFERDNVVWKSTAIDYNFLEQTGTFGASTLNMEPVLIGVGSVECVSSNEYLLHNATFTTCSLEHPHYNVCVKEARLVDNKHLTAKGATFYIGKVPVFYLPFWKQTLSSSVFSFRFGHSSEWGAFGTIRATVPLTGALDSITDLNLYTKRGVGLGQGFSWNSTNSVGGLDLFYLFDQDPNSKYTDPEIDTGRYRFKVEELYSFSDTHYLNTKWNYLSDPYVLKEFNRSEYRSYPQPENYASWVYGDSLLSTEVFANYRLNDFYDNTDRLDLLADIYRTRIGDSPFYFQSESSLAYLERVYKDGSPLNRVDSLRFDSANVVYMPQRYGFLSVVPRVGFRGPHYSKSAVDEGTEFRGTPNAGMEVSMQLSKVLSDRVRWYGTGLRHVIEPYADYNYADASTDPNRLPQFDIIDTLGDENKVKLGLRNVLQTKRNNLVSRFMDLDLYTNYLLDRNGAEHRMDSLFVDARLPLTERVTFDVDGEVDWNSGEVPFFNSRVAYRKNKDLLISMEHLYRSAEDQSIWTPRFDLYPEGRFSLFGYARYEDQSGELEEISFGGYANRCCMRYGLGCHFYDDGEFGIMLSIGLSAFPEANISSGF